ncbi:MAG: polysaccharide biosynthesis C-terminal domain-containing protein [Halomonas sp.]|jgi:putative MATE family efflux protein|uniref:MATE family efflux transporter n=1 Tax=Billgrantia tianxiuensis TaxID=2497861 RepID=A0A6I6SPL5_9GAMM|nr:MULTISPECIES: MATE family efflux transporter [Halomonas]MCE8034652.1 MATE family efflux transporter [Halomonas sp. MCCC 1A11057]MDX5434015.1 polysaccharide biosynthesis C-terminal domain-containing protein [Halomonas sp.]QHC50516.1 MATE family efflux transporter [Halomonas tianxiuensis]
MPPASAATSLGATLWRQTWPMAIGVLALLGFQLVDSAFVARLGTAPLAAQSFTFPLSFLIIGVQVGLGIAIAALISRALGAGEALRARRLGSLVLMVGSATIALLALVLWWTQAPIFSRLGADAITRALIRDYWAPQLFAAWLGAVLYFVYSLFRAHGDTRLPGKMMVMTSLVNLVLDPLLIFGVGPWEGLGLPGAAWATAIAFGCGLLMAIKRLRRNDWLARHGLKLELAASLRPFASIAGPAMISQLMPPLASMLAVSVVADLGGSAVAAWGLASRLETLALVVVLAMTMSLPPWLGRCYGAGDWIQIRRLIGLALKVVVVWQLSLGMILALLSPWAAHLLAGSPEVRDDLTVLIRFLLPSYAALGVCMLVVSAGNALGWPLRAMLMSAARLFLCYLPGLWLGASLGGLAGLAIGAALGNVLAGMAAWQLMRRMQARSEASEHGEPKLFSRERT